MLVNFGDFVDGKQDKVANPYIQLLPTTDDISEAHKDFVQVRLNGTDSTGNQTLLDNYTPSGPPDTRTSTSNSGFSDWLYKHKTILIIVGASIGGVLFILIAGLCFCRRRSNIREKDGRRVRFMQGVPVGGRAGYKRVDEPFPPYLPSYGKV